MLKSRDFDYREGPRITGDFTKKEENMAPPPPQTLALSDRLMALVQTLQFSWFMG